MIGDIRRVLLLPHIKVQNANALSSPFTVGFPAMTAWLGAVHALQRKVNASGFQNVNLDKAAVVSHDMNLQTKIGQEILFSPLLFQNGHLQQRKSLQILMLVQRHHL